MEKSIGFKVTIEYICPHMMSEKDFEEFGFDPMEAYRIISDDFVDSPVNFSESENVVKVELLEGNRLVCPQKS